MYRELEYEKTDELNSPLVSIWCVTYNHAPYIRDAIEGFLMQETNFGYEIVIHDDASTDGTANILREYEEMYPERIKVYYQPTNTFHRRDVRKIRNDIAKNLLHGKYIAYCEGDDYWIDSKKLQKQVDYMESHQECYCIGHNAIKRDYSTGEEYIINNKFKSGDVPVRQILFQDEVYLPTASIMTRGLIGDERFDFHKVNGDELLKLLCAVRGRIYYIDEVMSVYRFKTEGSWSARTVPNPKKRIINFLNYIDFLVKFNELYPKKFEKEIYERINSVLLWLHLTYSNLDEAEFTNIIQDIFEECDDEYIPYINWLNEKYNFQIPEIEYKETLKSFCEKNEKIMLWGTGKYAKLYTELLENNGVQIEGYIVSQRVENKYYFCGKKVWEIEEIARENSEIPIVVAINSGIWLDVLRKLLQYEIKNFYYPFHYDMYRK